MKRQIRITIVTILLIIVIWPWKCALAQDSLIAFETRLTNMHAQFDSLQRQMSALQQQADSLSIEITSLKEKADLNYLERKRLERYLQTAQVNAAQQEHTLTELNKLQKEIALVSKELSQLYDRTIDSLMMAMAQSPKKDRHAQQNLRRQIDMYRMRQHQLQQTAIMSNKAVTGELIIKPEELPEEILAKASYFRDLADKLRRHAAEVESRLRQVRQEATLRRKMTDLLADVRLFDQSDELVMKSRQATVKSSAVDLLSPANESKTPRSEAREVEVVPQMDRLLQIDVRSLPDDSVEEYINHLQTQRQRLLFQADSLDVLAQKYEKGAKNMLRTPQQPE